MNLKKILIFNKCTNIFIFTLIFTYLFKISVSPIQIMIGVKLLKANSNYLAGLAFSEYNISALISLFQSSEMISNF